MAKYGLSCSFASRSAALEARFGQELAPVVAQRVVQTRLSRRDQFEAHEACDVLGGLSVELAYSTVRIGPNLVRPS
jgi:hypothetical protein